jgi:hypothetical protein
VNNINHIFITQLCNELINNLPSSSSVTCGKEVNTPSSLKYAKPFWFGIVNLVADIVESIKFELEKTPLFNVFPFTTIFS